MNRIAIIGLAAALSGVASAHEIVHQESQGGWTSYQVRCDNGRTRYITENRKGFWARGKNYGDRKEAITAACKE